MIRIKGPDQGHSCCDCGPIVSPCDSCCPRCDQGSVPTWPYNPPPGQPVPKISGYSPTFFGQCQSGSLLDCTSGYGAVEWDGFWREHGYPPDCYWHIQQGFVALHGWCAVSEITWLPAAGGDELSVVIAQILQSTGGYSVLWSGSLFVATGDPAPLLCSTIPLGTVSGWPAPCLTSPASVTLVFTLPPP
jgi:hypothetical protein